MATVSPLYVFATLINNHLRPGDEVSVSLGTRLVLE